MYTIDITIFRSEIKQFKKVDVEDNGGRNEIFT